MIARGHLILYPADMTSFLFDDFMLWVWFGWSFLTILNGYIIADGFESAEEAVGFLGLLALVGGGLALFSRENVLSGAISGIKNFVLSFVLIPALPCLYIFPMGWRLSGVMGVDFFAQVLVATFFTASLGIALLVFWVSVLRVLRQSIHPFMASIIGCFTFALAPAAALLGLA